MIHFTTIAFVFVVFHLDSALNAIALFKSTTNLFLTGAAVTVTGLLLLSFIFIYWILYMGSVEWFEKNEEEPAERTEQGSSQIQ
jgi:hypothetical protein